jgi:sugar phosphate isomerase/epimerase
MNNSGVFVSTSGIKCQRISDAVRTLALAGFKYIELSGGSNYFQNWKDELLELGSEFELVYRLHNYFPPPEQHFVLNLATTDPIQLERSREMIANCINLSTDFGSTTYGFHAGFFVDAKVEELGSQIKSAKSFDRNFAMQQFLSEYAALRKMGIDRGVSLFIENNVISGRNLNSFGGKNLLMLCDSDEFDAINSISQINLLLDIAHLKVSSATLGRSFIGEAERLWQQSSYVHLSDNDGTKDSNDPIVKGSHMYELIKELGIQNKEITIEIYSGIEGIKETYENITELL